MAIANYSDTSRGYKLVITFSDNSSYTLNLALYLTAKGKGLAEDSKPFSERIAKHIIKLLQDPNVSKNRIQILHEIEENISLIHSMEELCLFVETIN